MVRTKTDLRLVNNLNDNISGIIDNNIIIPIQHGTDIIIAGSDIVWIDDPMHSHVNNNGNIGPPS